MVMVTVTVTQPGSAAVLEYKISDFDYAVRFALSVWSPF